MSRRRPSWHRGPRGRALRERLARRDGGRCFYCRAPFPDLAAATLDHYVPYCLWPCHRPRNLVLACEPCNSRKADALPLTVAWLLLAAVRRNGWGVAA